MRIVILETASHRVVETWEGAPERRPPADAGRVQVEIADGAPMPAMLSTWEGALPATPRRRTRGTATAVGMITHG